MITAFGKELRKIRIDRGETLKDMAAVLGVSVSFLSSVEVGKKNVPESWVELIGQHYELDDTTRESLRAAARDSVRSIKIDLQGTGQMRRNAALIFARNFDSVSEDTAKKIIDMLNQDQSEWG